MILHGILERTEDEFTVSFKILMSQGLFDLVVIKLHVHAHDHINNTFCVTPDNSMSPANPPEQALH